MMGEGVGLKDDFQFVMRSLSIQMFIKFPLDGMRINVIRYEPQTSLRDLSNSFSNSFIDFYSCEVVSSSDMRKNEA